MVLIPSEKLFLEFKEYNAKSHQISHEASSGERTHVKLGGGGPSVDSIFSCLHSQHREHLTLNSDHPTAFPP